jgi:hypothetical protein
MISKERSNGRSTQFCPDHREKHRRVPNDSTALWPETWRMHAKDWPSGASENIPQLVKPTPHYQISRFQVFKNCEIKSWTWVMLYLVHI